MSPPNSFIMPHAITHRQDPATELLRDRVRQLFRVLPAALAFDEEGIHDMRVTTRRLGVIVPLLARKPGGKRAKRAIRTMKRLRRAAGLSRDMDVCLALLDRHRKVSREENGGVAVLRRRLAAARRRSHRRMEKALAGIDTRELRQDLEAILARKAGDLFSILRLLRQEQQGRSEMLLSDVSAVGESYDPDLLHEVRSHVRRMRYLAEINARVVDRASDAPRLFREMQDTLGRLHDAHVLTLWLEKQIRASEKRGDTGPAWAARRLKRRFEETARDEHRAYLAMNPPAHIRLALKAMQPGDSAA